jgi:hypothetical protein
VDQFNDSLAERRRVRLPGPARTARRQYGSFAGKNECDVVVSRVPPGPGGSTQRRTQVGCFELSEGAGST